MKRQPIASFWETRSRLLFVTGQLVTYKPAPTITTPAKTDSALRAGVFLTCWINPDGKLSGQYVACVEGLERDCDCNDPLDCFKLDRKRAKRTFGTYDRLRSACSNTSMRLTDAKVLLIMAWLSDAHCAGVLKKFPLRYGGLRVSCTNGSVNSSLIIASCLCLRTLVARSPRVYRRQGTEATGLADADAFGAEEEIKQDNA